METKIKLEEISTKVNQGVTLSYKEELFLIEQKCLEILKQYIKIKPFSNQGQLDILETGNIEMIKIYIAERFFYPDAEYKLFRLGEKDLIKEYMKHHKFYDQGLNEAAKRLLEDAD